MNTKQAIELGAVLGRIFTPRECAELYRIGRALTGLAVKQCNYGLSDRDEKRRDNLGAKAVAICKPHRVKVIAGGDPRGYCLKLVHRKLGHNTWGGAEDGYGVA